ncbi:T9SS type A sorting domain-containing protein [Luteibaculum oceani]|uniref:T9SS type A sorting domain-containing protein n=1 Tax=Luteibaculum oceani TaxID=1294296 RepID=A0A5C6UZJ5_9FLAO|nr:T9SS type A sorting domain-containing protein [Luteibaculum oceani]TXC78812.1 T9SS type A sorting domain-containing protein [Luteibaculum oceani]
MRHILLLLSLGIFTGLVEAREPEYLRNAENKNSIRKSAAGCAPATAIAQLSFNNVRARIENGGNMWMNRANSTAFYEVPKNGGVHSIFSGALWMGGLGPNGDLKIAAVTFRGQGSDDFYPGPLLTDGSAEITSDVCGKFDRFWRASKVEALKHDAYWKIASEQGEAAANEAFLNYETPDAFIEWSEIANNGLAGYDRELAPYFDFNGDGMYTPDQGDYPGYDLAGTVVCRDSSRRVPLFGDTTIYWVFNDKGNTHTATNGGPIGMEIRAQAFAFADQTAINNMTFCNYVLINQGSQTLNNTYFGQWVDTDLGFSDDDYVGCDVQRGLGYCYNGDNDDQAGANSPGYGAIPPAVGIDFFQGPYQDDDGVDNYGPYDPILAPFGDKTVTYDEAISGNDSLGLGGNGIPYLGLGIGYGDGVIDNERFGMRKFVYYTRGTGATGDPGSARDHYNYLSGLWKDFTPFVYGGQAHGPTSGSQTGYPTDVVAQDAFCDFMFPGDTDPVSFGTRGVDYPAQNGNVYWTEVTAGTPQGDRRFMQSAGPFTLTPGQVNNITVGVVWARAETGNNLTSVEKLRTVDDIAQSLFDNCFQIFEGPDAPTVNVTELDREIILTLENPQTSNNFQEKYEKIRPEIPNDAEDRTYNFEGYQVYQLKDATVSVSDLNDPSKAVLISQSDIVNYYTDTATGEPDLTRPVAELVNYTTDPKLKIPIPEVKVEAAPGQEMNKGLVKAIRVTEDAFAKGTDRKLVNNKPYYFVAIAYGFNEYEPYNTMTGSGQPEPYAPSRKSATGGSIRAVSGIPHKRDNQDGGTVLRSKFGDKLQITRLEGKGNGGVYTRLTEESRLAIATSANFATDSLKYQQQFGPLDIRIVDPLNIVPAKYSLRVVDTSDVGDRVEIYNNPHWELAIENTVTGERATVTSDQTMDIGGQQLIFANVGPNGTEINMGISVNIKQVQYRKLKGGQFNRDWYTPPVGGDVVQDNPGVEWLNGLRDGEGTDPANWIRAGNVTGTVYADASVQSSDGEQGIDINGEYETTLSRMWGPGRVLASTAPAAEPSIYLMPQSAINNNSQNTGGKFELSLHITPSVDLVFTPNKDLWTRCVVFEASPSPISDQFTIKNRPSVDKSGRVAGDPGYNAAEGDLTSPVGMSWFPGYAVDPETGERLNIAFAEDSRFAADNGDDMLFNPSDRLYSGDPSIVDNIIAGGRHYVYILKNTTKEPHIRSTQTQMPAYDFGEYCVTTSKVDNIFRAVAWAGIPYVNNVADMKSYSQGYIPTETRVELRVARKFQPYPNNGLEFADSTTNSVNEDWSPLYYFSSEGLEPLKGQTKVVQDNLEDILAVPNPYYGYAKDYESGRLDNRIKFTNLPTRATIKIFTVNGTLIRQLEKDDTQSTIVEWDLKNSANIPISSGTYIIHIDMPGVGERIIKWFGVMRKVDLQDL